MNAIEMVGIMLGWALTVVGFVLIGVCALFPVGDRDQW